MRRRIIVVAAIQRRGKYLLTQQSERARHPGLWFFPGGTFELTETSLHSALKREIEEEVNAKIEVETFPGIYVQVVKGIQLICFYFKARIKTGSVCRSKEISDYKWFTIKELQQFSNKNIRPPYSLFKKIVKSLSTNKPVENLMQ